ncbi:hypothetical protein [Catenovulum sediminis]
MQNVWSWKANVRKARVFILLFGSSLLIACASSSQPVSPVLQDARAQVVELQHSSTNNMQLVQNLRDILVSFADVGYLWKADLLLANQYMVHGLQQQARASLQDCIHLNQSTELLEGQQSCQLLLYRLTEQAELLQQIIDNPASERLQALAYAYQGEFDKAQALLKHIPKDHYADLAYLNFQLGWHYKQTQYLHDALKYYRLAADKRGIVDTLFALAKVYHIKKEQGKSKHYSLLALRSAKINFPQLAIKIQNWQAQRASS